LGRGFRSGGFQRLRRADVFFVIRRKHGLAGAQLRAQACHVACVGCGGGGGLERLRGGARGSVSGDFFKTGVWEECHTPARARAAPLPPSARCAALGCVVRGRARPGRAAAAAVAVPPERRSSEPALSLREGVSRSSLAPSWDCSWACLRDSKPQTRLAAVRRRRQRAPLWRVTPCQEKPPGYAYPPARVAAPPAALAVRRRSQFRWSQTPRAPSVRQTRC
jgi:hypothetical protein